MVGTLEHNITLELEKAGVQARIPVRRGDALVHRITVSLTGGGEKYSPTGAMLAQIYALLPDGSTVSCDGEIGGDGKVTFIPGGGFFTLEGPVLCRLSLRGDDGGELYSPAFAFDTDGCFAAGAPTVPAEEYSRLEELLLRTLAAQGVCESIANELRNEGYGAPLSDSLPLMNGEASAGEAESAARADHVHPTDTTRMPGIGEMDTDSNITLIDMLPYYDSADKVMKKVTVGILKSLIQRYITSVASADVAMALTDSTNTSGCRATIPALTADAVLALRSDIPDGNMSFVGTALPETPISEGSSQNPITVSDGTSVTAVKGTVAKYEGTAYIYDGTVWTVL